MQDPHCISLGSTRECRDRKYHHQDKPPRDREHLPLETANTLKLEGSVWLRMSVGSWAAKSRQGEAAAAQELGAESEEKLHLNALNHL